MYIIYDKKATKKKNNAKYTHQFKPSKENFVKNRPAGSHQNAPQPVERKIGYRKREFLTNREKYFYNVLIGYAADNNYHLLSKIRLADLIEVDDQQVKKYVDKNVSFAKIRSKHIDFALCDRTNLEPLLLIEIDDSTHKDTERIERDKFVDKSLRQAGYKIIHVMTTNELSSALDYMLRKNASSPDF